MAPASNGPPLAGYHGMFFVRSPDDFIRIYPHSRLQIDSAFFAGKGVSDTKAVDGGTALRSRLFVRRFELEADAEIAHHVTMHAGVDFSQSVVNANGRLEQYAGKAGQDPTAGTARFSAVDQATTSASLADAWINYSFCDCLNFQLGQDQAIVTMENRTGNKVTPWMERNVAIRGFVVPTGKEMGVTMWGELPRKVLVYQVGVYLGDGQNRPQVDNDYDFLGRFYTRPFFGKKMPLSNAQIGVSARHGTRDPEYVGYDYPAVTTGQGWELWSPTYKDSQGRTIHVVPSGAQNLIGGELRLPFERFALQGEAYYVSNHTREAVDGYQVSNTERLGTLKGVGWYAQASWWPWGDPFVYGEPGGASKPAHLDLTKPVDKPKRGLELLAIYGAIDAKYSGASRDGVPDAKTPGTTTNPATKISVRELGFGVSYWHTKHLRLSANYIGYQTPDSGGTGNLALVPGNLGAKPDKGAHWLHEIGTRVGLMF